METKAQKELLILKILNRGIRVKEVKTGEILSLKTGANIDICEMHTITFEVEKEWIFKKQKYVSGKIKNFKLVTFNC